MPAGIPPSFKGVNHLRVVRAFFIGDALVVAGIDVPRRDFSFERPKRASPGTPGRDDQAEGECGSSSSRSAPSHGS